MRAHYFQHVPFEGLGSIDSWLEAKGYQLTHTRFFESTNLPNPRAIDLFVVLGGPMSVNDEDTFPWLVVEKQFIREVIEAEFRFWAFALGHNLLPTQWGRESSPIPSKKSAGCPFMRLLPTTIPSSHFRHQKRYFIGMERHLICHRMRYGLRGVRYVRTRLFNSESRSSACSSTLKQHQSQRGRLSLTAVTN